MAVQADAAKNMISLEIFQESQEAFNFYRFNAGTLDGVFGPGTLRTIAAYQSDRYGPWPIGGMA